MSKRKLEALRLAIDLRDEQANNAHHHAEKLEEREAEVQRLIGEIEREIEDATGLPCQIGGLQIKGHVVDAECPEVPEGVDVNDPKTWREGDVVECVNVVGGVGVFTAGKHYPVFEIDHSSALNSVRVIDDDGDAMWSGGIFRFVRRPS